MRIPAIVRPVPHRALTEATASWPMEGIVPATRRIFRVKFVVIFVQRAVLIEYNLAGCFALAKINWKGQGSRSLFNVIERIRRC